MDQGSFIYLLGRLVIALSRYSLFHYRLLPISFLQLSGTVLVVFSKLVNSPENWDPLDLPIAASTIAFQSTIIFPAALEFSLISMGRVVNPWLPTGSGHFRRGSLVVSVSGPVASTLEGCSYF